MPELNKEQLLVALNDSGEYDREILEALIEPNDYMTVTPEGVKYQTREDPFAQEVRPYSDGITKILNYYKYAQAVQPEVDKESLRDELARATIKFHRLRDCQRDEKIAELKGVPFGAELDNTLDALKFYLDNLTILESLSND